VEVATKIEEKFIDLSHGKTRYFEAGEGYPTILIHGAGFLSGADGWLNIVEPLAEHLHIYTIDCLNWGPGDVFDQELSFCYLVDHVREFMDALGIEKANFVGHSMGGWILNLLIYESPERVNKAVLSAAGGSQTRPLQNMVDFKVPTEEQIRDQIGKRVATFPEGIDREHILQEYLDKAADPKQGEAFAKVMKHMTNPMTRQRYNTVRRLPWITVPTLIAWGTEDKTNDISMGHTLHESIKGSKMVTFEGAGHGIYTDQPKEYVKALLDFLP
jgi:2-hydroxy-6-oxonona-2,4-dienedioate hydrolase